jgi:hypothetical protein
MKDPLYGAYRDARNKRAARGEAGEVGDAELNIGGGGGGGGAAAARAAASAAASSAAAASASASAAPPRARSLLELFERAAAWTLKDIAEGLGAREADVRAEVAEKCDYLRSGKWAKHWLVKAVYRTPAMPKPEAEAEAVRAPA